MIAATQTAATTTSPVATSCRFWVTLMLSKTFVSVAPVMTYTLAETPVTRMPDSQEGS